MLSTVGLPDGSSSVPIQLASVSPGGSGQSTPEIPTPGTPGATPYGLTPAQVRAAYGFGDISFDGGITGDGTGQTIAIVVAYEQPDIQSDLAAFDKQYGIPAPFSFAIYSEPGATPAPPGNWGIETSLDVEWAHAMAPGASILLVEAASAMNSDLYGMVQYAKGQPGVSVVSMSFGTMEFSGETSFDSYFTTPPVHTGVTFVAGAGDMAGGGEYPAASPNVLAVGGTTLTTDAQGDDLGETAWASGGGGISPDESQPSFQAGVVTQSTTQRTTPDVAFNAGTAASIYDSYDFGSSTPWSSETGTSLATPNWSALIAIADQGTTLLSAGTLDGPSQTLPGIYKLGKTSTAFRDISTGSNGNPAGLGYDLATGLGTPIAEAVAEGLSGNIGIPTTLSPTGVVNTATPTLTWSAVPGAVAYHLTASGINLPAYYYTNVLSVTVGDVTSYTPPASTFVASYPVYWQVQAETSLGAIGNPSNAASFTIQSNMPILISPTNSSIAEPFGGFAVATTNTPTFTWSNVPGAVSYTFTLTSSMGNGGNTNYIYSNKSVSGTSFTDAQPLASGLFYAWQVDAIFSPYSVTESPYESFTVSEFATPTLLSPTYNATVYTTTPLLQWSAVPGAAGYDLSLYDMTKQTNIYNQTLIVYGTTYIPDPVLYQGDSYSWVVTPIDGSGNSDSESGTKGEFNASPSADVIPGNLVATTLTSANSGVIVETTATPTFSWSAVPGAAGYELYINGSTIDTTMMIPTTGTSFTPTIPLENGQYYDWYVRPFDKSGDVGPLSTNTGDYAIETGPILLSPTEGETLTTYLPTFQWQAIGGVASYQVDVYDQTRNTDSIVIDGLTGTSYTPNIPLADGDHYTWYLSYLPQATSYIEDTIGQVAFTVSVPGGGANPLNAPTPTGPTGALSTTSPTFSWTAVTGAVGYALYLSDYTFNNGYADNVLRVNGTSYTPASPLVDSDTYTWYVVAFDNSGDVSPNSQTLTFNAATPVSGLGIPTPIGPVGTITQDVPTFSWSAVTGAAYYYLSIVSLDGGYVPFSNNTYVYSTSYTGQQFGSGTYQWYVAPVFDETSYPYAYEPGVAASSTFTVNAQTIGAPTITAPTGGSSVNTKTPTITWTAVSGATSYKVLLYDETVDNDVSTAFTVSGTSFTPTTPLINTHQYGVSVQAGVLTNGQVALGPSSNFDIFSISYPGTPNVDPFQGPVNTTTPTFQWSSVVNAAYYLITIIDTTSKTTPYSAVKVVGTSFVPPTPLTGGDTFQFFVQAFDNSGDGGIVSQTIIVSPFAGAGTPVLNAYSGASTGVTPTLSWTAASSAVTYQVTLTDTTRGTSAIYSVTNSRTSIALTTPLNSGDTYHWTVLGINSVGGKGNMSSTDTFVPKAQPAGLVDFDGDGKADFSVFGKDPNTGRYDYRIIDSSTGKTVVYDNNGYGYGNPQSIPIIGDFFGDGRSSYALWTPNAFGGMTFTAVSPLNYKSVSINFGGTADLPVVADLDGDGKADFGVYGYQAGLNYRFDFVLSSYNFSVTVQDIFNNNGYGYGNAQSIPLVADFDGSGKAGFGLYNRAASGSTFTYVSPSSGVSFSRTIGTATDTPTVVSYDGDGKADLALYGLDPTKPGTYRYLVLDSTSGYSTTAEVSFNNFGYGYGNATSIPVMADYEGDGRADFGLFTSDGKGGNEFVYLLGQVGAGVTIDFATATDIPLTAPTYLIAKKIRGY